MGLLPASSLPRRGRRSTGRGAAADARARRGHAQGSGRPVRGQRLPQPASARDHPPAQDPGRRGLRGVQRASGRMAPEWSAHLGDTALGGERLRADRDPRRRRRAPGGSGGGARRGRLGGDRAGRERPGGVEHRHDRRAGHLGSGRHRPGGGRRNARQRRRHRPPGPGGALARRHQQLVRSLRPAAEHPDRSHRPRHRRDGGHRGRGAGGTAIGVAPGAQWISARVFNDQGSSTTSAIHRAFQWLLDPDGDPATPDAPQVVNASWSFANPGCNLEFAPDIQALRAAASCPSSRRGTLRAPPRVPPTTRAPSPSAPRRRPTPSPSIRAAAHPPVASRRPPSPSSPRPVSRSGPPISVACTRRSPARRWPLLTWPGRSR